jgi:localization factor PodJL
MKWALPILILSVFMSLAHASEDEPAGLKQLRAEAEAGSAESQFELGILYEYGYRMPDNLVPALSWYLRASETGHVRAAQRRDALQARLKPAEVDEARRLAREVATKTPAAKPPTAPAPTPESTRGAEPAPAPAAVTPPALSGPSNVPSAADTKPLF